MSEHEGPARLRILTLANALLDESSGSGYVICNYARGLRALGHEVTLLGPPDYEPFFGRARAIRYRQAFGLARAAWRARRAGYDILEFYGGEAWLALLLLRRFRRRSFLLVSHSNGLETHSEEAMAALGGPRRSYQWSHARLHAAGFRRADALVTVGGYDADYARRAGYVPEERLLALDNPLPDTYLGRPFVAERPQRVGFCGAWIERKGVVALAAGVSAFLRRFPAWRFALAGVGEGFAVARHFPADVHDRIEVIPQAEREGGLAAFYETVAVLVVPSLYESFGLVTAEALACGCAVVATPVGFARDLRGGEEAIHLHAPVVAQIEQALIRLAQDESLRRRLAQAGHRRVQALRWPEAIRRLEAAYLRWVAELRQQPSPVTP